MWLLWSCLACSAVSVPLALWIGQGKARNQPRNQVNDRLTRRLIGTIVSDPWREIIDQSNDPVWDKMWPSVGGRVWHGIDPIESEVLHQAERQIKDQS